MTDRPILFSAPMIRALLAGTKTQTRRLLTSGNTYFNGCPWTKDLKAASWDWDRAWVDQGPSPAGNPGPYLKLPYVGDGELAGTVHRIYPKVQPSDRLWVREAWRTERAFDGIRPRDLPIFELPGLPIFYEASDNGQASTWGNPWGEQRRPSMFMPRWASRLTLVMTGVKVERLLDISEEDAIAEGVVFDEKKGFWVPGVDHPNSNFPYLSRPTAREMYAALWDVINGPGAWGTNPWVVALTFTVHKQNIDAMKEAA